MRRSRSVSRASSLACRSSTCSSRVQRWLARARGGADGADTDDAWLGKGREGEAHARRKCACRMERRHHRRATLESGSALNPIIAEGTLRKIV